MSPEPFSKLREDFPDQAEAWEILREWADGHRGVAYLAYPRLARLLTKRLDLSEEDVVRIVRAINQSGLFQQKYAVEVPGGGSVGPFDDVPDIPDQLSDSLGRMFETENGTVVPVLVETNVYA